MFLETGECNSFAHRSWGDLMSDTSVKPVLVVDFKMEMDHNFYCSSTWCEQIVWNGCCQSLSFVKFDFYCHNAKILLEHLLKVMFHPEFPGTSCLRKPWQKELANITVPRWQHVTG